MVNQISAANVLLLRDLIGVQKSTAPPQILTFSPSRLEPASHQPIRPRGQHHRRTDSSPLLDELYFR